MVYPHIRDAPQLQRRFIDQNTSRPQNSSRAFQSLDRAQRPSLCFRPVLCAFLPSLDFFFFFFMASFPKSSGHSRPRVWVRTDQRVCAQKQVFLRPKLLISLPSCTILVSSRAKAHISDQLRPQSSRKASESSKLQSRGNLVQLESKKPVAAAPVLRPSAGNGRTVGHGHDGQDDRSSRYFFI